MSACKEEPEPDPPHEDAGEIARDAEPEDSGVPPIPEVCPRPPGEAILGDINGDGVVDVADPIALENHHFRGGRNPVCSLAADFNDDGRVEVDDALALSSYLVTGTQRGRAFPPEACAGSTAWPDGACAPLALELTGSSRVTAGSFRVKLAIVSPELAVQGWSTSIVAEGCTLVRASTDETAGAEIWDEPAGLRHLGYSVSTLVDRGAITYTVLSVNEDVTLPARSGATAVATIDLEAPVPESGCAPCTIRTADDLFWRGRAIELVVAADGYSYRPAALTAVIDVCAP